VVKAAQRNPALKQPTQNQGKVSKRNDKPSQDRDKKSGTNSTSTMRKKSEEITSASEL
jgi:hypothetical protein